MVEATGRDEDYAEYWMARPLHPALDKETAVQVVGKRCVYVNDHRVAGGKPYYSENLPNTRFNTTVRGVLEAFPDSVLRAALKERRDIRKHFNEWRRAKEQQP